MGFGGGGFVMSNHIEFTGSLHLYVATLTSGHKLTLRYHYFLVYRGERNSFDSFNTTFSVFVYSSTFSSTEIKTNVTLIPQKTR